MFHRRHFFDAKIIGLLAIIGILLLYGWYLPFRATGTGEAGRGIILFWYDRALYTINADGAHLTRLSPAAEADPKRQIAVSPGCFGADAGCYVLIKHVLYDAAGHGLPLPINRYYQWINAPSVWAPDGNHLAYMVAHTDTGERALLAYNVQEQTVWRIADEIDDSVVPAWSAGCTDVESENCYIAYGVKTPAGESGNRTAVQNVISGETQILATLSGRGHVLRWSDDDELFYGGGEVGWYSAFTNRRLEVGSKNITASAVSPDMRYTAYTTVPSPQAPAGLWLASNTDAASPQKLFVFKNDDGNEQSAPQQILWSTDGKSFLAFDQGELIHYNIQRKTTETLYRNDAHHVFENYVFSPDRDGVALVEKPIASPDPRYRLFVVWNTGETTTLLPSSKTPIIVLAWLPANYSRKLLPVLKTDLS